MVIVHGRYEVSELVAGCAGSAGLYLAGINVLPPKYVPDFPAVLFLLSSVMAIHHVRIVKCPPIQQLWHLFLELVGIYIATQVLVALIWEQFHALLDVTRDAMVNTTLGLIFIKYFPRLIVFMRLDVCYFAQWVLTVMVTSNTLRRTKTLGYILSERRLYQYHQKPSGYE